MARIVRGIKAALAQLWQPKVIDLTRPGAGRTQRERELLWQAGLAIAAVGYTRTLAPVIKLDEYRMEKEAAAVSGN